jgi:predicted RNase H-related nuclease YkuK (DUF458 family)
MENFKLFGGNILEDLGQYARDYINSSGDDHSQIIVYVGTDSKQLRHSTLYATAIAFYHIGGGAHIVFRRVNIPKVRDMFTRLYNEVEMTMEVSEYLHKELEGHYNFEWNEDNIWMEIGGDRAQRLRGNTELKRIIDGLNSDLQHQKTVICDLDLNPSKNHKSNMVYDAGVGTIKGNGFRVRTKPHAWVASCAADLLCK